MDRIKSDAFAGFENAYPVIEYVHMFTRGEREFASLAVSVNLRSMLSGNEVFDRILNVLDDRLFASVIVDVTDGAESYEPASIAINDLTEQQTDEIFDVISLFDDRFDKESLFSEAVRQVRSSFDDIRDGIQFEITDGAGGKRYYAVWLDGEGVPRRGEIALDDTVVYTAEFTKFTTEETDHGTVAAEDLGGD